MKDAWIVYSLSSYMKYEELSDQFTYLYKLSALTEDTYFLGLYGCALNNAGKYSLAKEVGDRIVV
jgi:hypothetical protein